MARPLPALADLVALLLREDVPPLELLRYLVDALREPLAATRDLLALPDEILDRAAVATEGVVRTVVVAVVFAVAVIIVVVVATPLTDVDGHRVRDHLVGYVSVAVTDSRVRGQQHPRDRDSRWNEVQR